MYQRHYWSRLALLCLLALTLLIPTAALANEYRAWWVDGWSGGFMNQSQVDTMISNLRAANCNAVFVEVRRSADVAYVGHMGEPYMSGLTPSGFDALQAIINAAHDTSGGKKRIEVHAWMVVFRTGGNSVYSAHHSTPTGSLTNLDNYWPTRDSAGAEESAKAFDPGHPLCEDYLTKVFMDIASNYDIDGVHYDYVRFTANDLGYNPTSVARYNARYGLTGQPSNTNSQWKQWRRDQITNLVRRVYHKIQIVKPSVKVSGAFVCGAPGPSTPDRSGFTGTTNLQAYTQYYQDWDAWMREGIVDIAAPMTYFDMDGAYVADWNKWLQYQKDNHDIRHMIVGPGTYMNTSAHAIEQLLATRTASSTGHYVHGFSGYEYQEPYSSATWGDVNTVGTWANTFKNQVTPTWTDVPVMNWKSSPTKGFLHGTVLNGTAWVDGAHITTTAGGDQYTDGTGFYGFTELTPGTYSVTCTASGLGTQTKSFTIAAGQVTVVNFTWGITTGMSGYVRTSSGAAVAGARIVGPNGSYVSTSASDGSYTLPGMAAGTYSFRALKTDYTTDTRSATITAGATATVNFTIDPNGGGTISGYVRDSESHGISGATVATTTGGYSTATGADGQYSLSGVAAGTYSATASMPGHNSQTISNIVVTNGETTLRDFTINPYPVTISSITATDITDTTATITWTTNVPATGQIEYGPTISMGTLTPLDSNLVTSHSVTLTGLMQNHIYHYKITSANSLGQSTTSGKYIFFTTPQSSVGAEVIIDNTDPGWAVISGTWNTGSGSGQYGTDYRFADNVTGTPTAWCSWTPDLPFAGTYDVFVWYRQGANRATNAPFTINCWGDSVTVPVNQQTNGGKWNLIASSLLFDAGTAGNVTLNNNANTNVVMADAVKFVSTSAYDPGPPSIPTGLTVTATSTTQMQLSWTASTDPAGIGGYRIYRNSVLIDAVTGTSYTDSGLLPNSSYTYAVAAYDIWGNLSNQSSPVGKYTLCLPIAVTCDKPTSTWQTDSNTFTFTNTVGFGGQTIDHIRYVWDRNPTHTWTNSETSWTSGTNICTASPGANNWYLHARAYNPNNVPNGQVDMGPYYCDTTAPSSPAPVVEKYVTATNQLTCSWPAVVDSESGVTEYQYAIGKTAGAIDTKGWTSTGTSTSVTATGLTLDLDQPYYFTVKAKNGAGTWSAVGNSSSTTPARNCASIAAAKAFENNEAIILTGRYVTYGASDGAFIQDPNGVAALYLPEVTTFAPGNIVKVGGILSTSGLLRSLTATDPQVTGGTGAISPMGMAIGSLGGAYLDQWQTGLPGSRGANNMGMLVRVAGDVVSSTSTYFIISDGTRQVMVLSTANPGSGRVVVTGISSSTIYISQTIPMIITRSVLDVRPQ